MQRTLALLLLIASASIAPAQEISIVVKGDSKSFTNVPGTPFVLEVPDVADVYLWSAPPGVDFTGDKNSIKIKSAPEGTLKFSVKAVKINPMTMKITAQAADIYVVLGKSQKQSGPAPQGAGAPPIARTAPRVAVEPSTGIVDKDVTVKYADALPGDWVGLFDASDKLIDWRLCLGKSSSAIFASPAIGQYTAKVLDATDSPLVTSAFSVQAK